MALVKRGGRQDYICEGCGKLIPKKTSHVRNGSSPFKRYHPECLPKPKVQGAEETTINPAGASVVLGEAEDRAPEQSSIPRSPDGRFCSSKHDPTEDIIEP